MAACPNCTSENASGRLRCSACGTALVRASDTRKIRRDALPKSDPAASALLAEEPGATPPAPAPAPPAAPAVESRPAPPPPNGMLVSSVFDAPFFLHVASTVSIGRSEDNNIALPVNQVSRQHAIVKWDGEGFAIIDKKSTNGTFVNDELVRRRRLKHGDRIEVGPFEIVFLDPGADPNGVAAYTDSTTGVVAVPGAFSGDLAEVLVSEICQLIELNQKTGILVFHEGERRGRIYFAGGRAVHAEYRELLGDGAALELLGLTKGRFRFFARIDVSVRATIARTVQSLLLEAARRLDEGSPSP